MYQVTNKAGELILATDEIHVARVLLKGTANVLTYTADLVPHDEHEAREAAGLVDKTAEAEKAAKNSFVAAYFGASV